MFRSKKLSLLMALVFAFTVIMPVGAAFAAEDNTSISGSYRYVKADDEVFAGVVSVVYDDMDTDTAEVIVQMTLPDGVDFTDEPDDLNNWVTINGVTGSSDKVDSASDYFEAKFVGINSNFDVDFDFGYGKGTDADNDGNYYDTGDVALDIDDDFTGNLEVAVEVIGLNGAGDIIWTDNDDVIIAKVSGGDVTVDVGDTKKVSAGKNKEVADITLEESMGGAFGKDSGNEVITLEIETDGVEFNTVDVKPTRLDVNVGTDNNGNFVADTAVSDGNTGNNLAVFDTNSDNKNTFMYVRVDSTSGSLPGKIAFDDIRLNISPSVNEDIEISVTSNGDADIDETVTVATVGDVTAEVADIDDNDGTVYAGQDKDLDVEFKIKTTDGSNFKDDMITFKLNQGKFNSEANKLPKYDGTAVDLYDDDEAFYVSFDGDYGDDEITIKNISVLLDNDAEPGDLTLTIEGDYGDLGEITIAQVAKPFTVTAEKAEIMAEALGQAAGDIIITETDDGAFKKNQYLYFEMPSGVELKGKPSVEVTEGSADAEIDDYDEDFFVVKITEESSSKPSTLRVYDIEYDTGKLALAGDVEVEIYGDIDEDVPGTNPAEPKVIKGNNDWDFDDDSMIASVVNATVVDQNAVTATFTVGDEGVVVKNGRTLVQVNTLCDILGLQKSWDEVNKIAYFVKGGTVVAFPIDKNEISINGNVLPVDQGGTIIDGFTYATLRGLEMAFGGELDWDNDTKTATFKF